MLKVNKTQLLQLLIFVFAFGYRIVLMLWQTYPPGADIGVHESVINSITQPENADLLWNYYQMGGGETLAFPGYHIFASILITFTGIPSYLAQAIIVALFSSLIVLAAFLVTRIVLSESVALIVAFFVAVSRLDIEMLSWGGYPNITALFLIPLTFYLFLKRDQLKSAPFLVFASVLVASLFLTHSLSAAVFVGITAVTSLVVLVFPKLFGESRKNILYWVLPLFIGALIVSPFLANAVPLYLNKSATFTGTTAVTQALLNEQMVPVEAVLGLVACIVTFFFVSKKVKGQFFSLPVFLLIMWIFVPLLLTQVYLVGLYVDYVRFPYFLVVPLIVLVAVMIDSASGYFANVFGAYYGLNGQSKKTIQSFNKQRSRFLSGINCKTVRNTFQVGFLVILLFGLPIFLVPWDGFTVRGYYQFMNDPGYQSIQWAKQNTVVDSVFVSDHHYGWWLAGFGQRPTITAVDLQCLTLAREVNMSKTASYLLDTDYMIDNGYIQVREDGGYIGRDNPLFLANLNWTNYPYGFFQFNSSEITLFYRDDNNTHSVNVAELPVTGMQLVNADSDSPSIVVNKANSDFSYSEIITVTKGNLFANMTITVQSNNPTVSLDWLNFVVNSQGKFQQPLKNTLATLDSTTDLCGQLIFEQKQPEIINLNPKNPCITQLSYNLQGESGAQLQILVGIFAVSESISQNPLGLAGLKEILSANLANLPTVPDLPVTTFDYKVALQEYNVSYIANRDFEVNSKYADDP
ncbi:MAG: hypothetical protein NWF03_01010, partial [Candidatus Bathyarchaeota archaeon]|nr:hypothetical protein [Candidatus Bathyarchaeota archaeon]